MMPRRTIQIILARDPVCVIAGPNCTVEATVADHRANRGSGGSSVLDAFWCLIGACRLCNGWKEDCTGADRTELERRGVRVLKASTNALTAVRARATPIEYPDGSWWVLLDDGTRREAS